MSSMPDRIWTDIDVAGSAWHSDPSHVHEDETEYLRASWVRERLFEQACEISSRRMVGQMVQYHACSMAANALRALADELCPETPNA